MHILICHERFLFRFGADRVLILLGIGLRKLGHRITVMANRWDSATVDSFATDVIEAPAFPDDYLHSNERTEDWLRETWRRSLPALKPDLVIVGGWPFISSIGLFRQSCGPVVFIDFGVVPSEGYDEGMAATLAKLRTLRRENLWQASVIAPISNFVASSQSIADAQGKVEVCPILLGANHMERVVQHVPGGKALDTIRALKKRRRKIVLSLGRWEPGCYKNSDAAFSVLRLIHSRDAAAVLVILSDANTRIPADLKDAVYPIGFPDDSELQELMRQSDLGISLSRWEGFNLPLAEMQWLGKPALAFACGAHPEVILSDWFLCQDQADMAAKSCELLSGGGPVTTDSWKTFRNLFTWDRYISEFAALLERVAPVQPLKRAVPGRILIDVSKSVKDPANSGVIRVTRQIGRALQLVSNPLFAIWDAKSNEYVWPTTSEFAQLGAFNGPKKPDDQPLSMAEGRRASVSETPTRPECLLLPETTAKSNLRQIQSWAKERGLRTAAIFYDAIPVLRPDLCNQETRNDHADYMKSLAEIDVVIPISDFSASCLRQFWQERSLKAGRIETNLLPGEFGGSERNREIEVPANSEVRILCVSTLEPRKNHRTLIEACQLLDRRLDWSLTLVGNRYSGGDRVAEYVENAACQDSRIRWLGIVDDPTLHRLYREATFTVYPSVIEGFGMPILESLWHARPVICHNSGVMAELARDGGCLTVDVTDAPKLSQEIDGLAKNNDALRELSRQAIERPLKTWQEYALTLVSLLATSGEITRDPTNVLYPGCLVENWQMHDSERLALTALLARCLPKVSIEVGTYEGGSLSLISQYSESVFSIDIDSEIPEKLRRLRNVTFLTGRSSDILSPLLRELDAAAMPPDFILIDGDHSIEGIRNDIAAIVSYVPKKALFVMLHDSFNPECRAGMISGGWERSPYVHFVEIDFVPGRIVEHDGPTHGQLWGGFGLAFLQPTPRDGDLVIGQACRTMFDTVLQSRAALA